MKTTRAALLAPAVLFSALVSHAQSPATPPAPAEQATPAVAPASAAPSETPASPAARRRAVSPALASSLAATMPKYSPPVEPPPKTPEEEEADQPRNQIIRLPQVVVEGDRPPVFTERQLYTRAELARLASSRYLSELDRGVLNRFTLPIVGQSSAEQRAMSIYEDEERQRNIAAANQAFYLLKQTDPAAAAALKRDAADAYIRPSEFTRISTER
ncbi:hypothetical protein MASR2M8_23030 [Opitutaceae bacterium]